MNLRSSCFSAPPIAAVCTAPGKAAIAVVRISGSGAFRIADALCSGVAEMGAGEFRLRKIRDPRFGSGEVIDEAIVLAFRAPHSYTGEDVVEFQTHGGAMSAARVLEAALALGAEPAGAGEFTKRAFLNGRLDLSAAEAVMDLIGAESERAARTAAEQLGGALGRRIGAMLDALLAVCADIEASLDFADDETSSILAPARVPERLDELRRSVRALSATWREGRLLREGALVVLSGAPNAGKSTLFNALLGTARSIVTDIPGTTRDSVEEALVIDGIPIRLADTAGIRVADSVIERLGVERAEDLIAKADLNLQLADLSDFDGVPRACADNVLTVYAKADLFDALPENALCVSALTGAGLDALKAAISAKLLSASAVSSSSAGTTAVSARHRALLDEAADAIDAALKACGSGAGDRSGDCAVADSAAITAQSLRAAAESLGRITGRVYSDELLNAVFTRFCVGK